MLGLGADGSRVVHGTPRRSFEDPWRIGLGSAFLNILLPLWSQLCWWNTTGLSLTCEWSVRFISCVDVHERSCSHGDLHISYVKAAFSKHGCLLVCHLQDTEGTTESSNMTPNKLYYGAFQLSSEFRISPVPRRKFQQELPLRSEFRTRKSRMNFTQPDIWIQDGCPHASTLLALLSNMCLIKSVIHIQYCPTSICGHDKAGNSGCDIIPSSEFRLPR